MNYSDWEKTVTTAITGDSLWRMTAYRYALFLADLAWAESTKLLKDERTRKLAGQLYSAVGSVGANLAEGYSRGSGKDRARFYEYALGSAREARDWYFKGRHILDEAVAEHRMKFLSDIVRLVLTMIPQQRTDQHLSYYVMREELAWPTDREPPEQAVFSAQLLENAPVSQ